MRRVLASAIVVAAVLVFMFAALGSGSGHAGTTYKIELDNAFGLVQNADFKVAGVRAGKISKIDLPSACIKGGGAPTCHALVTVTVTEKGFGSFKSDVFCQTRPESLIGEYFIDCEPGQYGKSIKPGSVIPVSHTQSTIPMDLLNNVMRMPYRERFSLIINELGAAVAGRSGDLQAALRRAVPALTETDNLLNLLANDSHTIQQLNVNADTVITALANNSKDVTHFIDEANKAATASATQQRNIAATWHDLPPFLEQLKPAMAQLGVATDANLPVLRNLQTGSGQLARFFHDLPPFAHASLPSLRALGQASVTGKQAATAATPTIKDLNQFAKPTPELAQNLNIILHDLDNRNRAVEADKRSPGGKGYTGLEALLEYAFNQGLAINVFSSLGHLLTVDAFVDPICSPYASPQTIADNIAQYGDQARRCYSWLGPNQPGVNETDPSNPKGCVPDPGGAPDGEAGPHTTACKLPPSSTIPTMHGAPDTGARTSAQPTAASPQSSSGAASGGGGPPNSSSSGGLASSLGQVLSTLGRIPAAGANAAAGALKTASSSTKQPPSAGSQAQQLLNYLLAP